MLQARIICFLLYRLLNPLFQSKPIVKLGVFFLQTTQRLSTHTTYEAILIHRFRQV